MNVIDDMLRSSPIHEEVKEPIKQNQEDCQPIFELKGQIQEDQIVPSAEENGENEEEATVEAATASSVTVKHDFKRKTWNFEHFGSDENRHGFKFRFLFSKLFISKATKIVIFLAARMALCKMRSVLL